MQYFAILAKVFSAIQIWASKYFGTAADDLPKIIEINKLEIVQILVFFYTFGKSMEGGEV